MGTMPITTGQFLTLLYEKILSQYGYTENGLFLRGRREGWLTESDELSENMPLSRGAAARILHEILRKIIKEAEEEDWSAATELADLYDCNRCVQHVAQVYGKGIMGAVEEGAEPVRTEKGKTKIERKPKNLKFLAEAPVSKEEAELFIERLLHPEQRILPKQGESVPTKNEESPFPLPEQGESAPTQNQETSAPAAKKISRAEAEHFFTVRDAVLAVDVGRDTVDLEVPRKMRVPMMQLLENPFLLEEYREYVLLLYCNGGYQSELAANCLSGHGYPNVFYFGMEV